MHTEIKPANLRSCQKRSLSVVLLCFNDGAVIRKCVEQAFKVLEPITSQLQIIVIEDGSLDDSSTVLSGLKALYPSLEVVFHRQNRGYGRSLAEGIGIARNEYILCSDGDNQFDFRDGIQFLKSADGGFEIVSGCRRPRADQWYRRTLGWICNAVVRFTFALRVEDVDCGFKLMKRQAAQSLFPTRSNLAVWVEAMATAERYGFRSTNLVVHHRPRETGNSTVFNLENILRLSCELVCLEWQLKLRRHFDQTAIPRTEICREVKQP
jgi:glycosyltransferase involved in cell wall biosynthesis